MSAYELGWTIVPSPREQKYIDAASKIGNLVSKKQAAYGDSFGKSGAILRVLYPTGIPVEKFDDALTVVRVIDKLFRIATDSKAFGENPWQDIAGYALLSVVRDSCSSSASSSSSSSSQPSTSTTTRRRRTSGGRSRGRVGRS